LFVGAKFMSPDKVSSFKVGDEPDTITFFQLGI